MTPKERAAMQQALEALETIKAHSMNWRDLDDDIITLRNVLQESENANGQELIRFGCLYPGGRLEVFKTRKRAQEYVDGSLRNGADVKLIELYAAPVEPVKQEPVAETVGDVTNTGYVYVKALVEKIPFRTKLYAAPVRTKDLTDEAAEELSKWLSAALDDPKVCEEYKNAINGWYDAAMPFLPTKTGKVPRNVLLQALGGLSAGEDSLEAHSLDMYPSRNDDLQQIYDAIAVVKKELEGDATPVRTKDLTDEEIYPCRHCRR